MISNGISIKVSKQAAMLASIIMMKT